METNRWQLSRAGLVNFWYYDEEAFEFADGKLLLRGTNGSGKSVTMQSLIPVVLDGKKSPDRLDPFGSKARRMEDYLLGEKEVTGYDERTGYLYLEFMKPMSSQYLTIGIGLKAKRNASMDFWGFSIQDNRRVGIDFSLYNKEYNAELQKDDRIPLGKRELEKRIGAGGRVVFSQGEYAEMVNKLLFGFQSPEAYEDLIKLLIQLRSPKLSKDFKPTVIYNILEHALPGLSDEELRPLSDAIESMDRTKLQLEHLERDHKSLARIVREYTAYNRYIWYDKAKGLTEALAEVQKTEQRKAQFTQNVTDEQAKLEKLASQIHVLQAEEQQLHYEHEQLRDHDLMRAAKEKVKLEADRQEQIRRLKEKQQASDGKRQQMAQLRRVIDDCELKIREADKEITDLLESLEQESSENEFPAHEVARGEFERARAGYSMELWQKEASDYRNRVQQSLEQAQKVSAAVRVKQEAEQELGEARKQVDELVFTKQKWERVVEEEKERLISSFHEWQGGVQLLRLQPDSVREVIHRVSHFEENHRYDDVREPVMKANEQVRQTLRDKLGDVQREQQEKHKQRSQIVALHKTWREKKDPEPPRNEQIEQARQWLQSEQIPHIPLYAAVEFREEVTPAMRAQIESALTEAGLLDALIVSESHVQKIASWSEQVKDRIILPDPQLFSHTIMEWFVATPAEESGVGKAEIEAVLQTILCQPDQQRAASTFISENGRFGLGVLLGNAPVIEKSVYVGREARRRYREEQLTLLEKQLVEIDQEIAFFAHLIEETQANLRVLAEELGQLPKGDDLITSLQSLTQTTQKLEIWEEQVQLRNEKVRKALEQLLRERDILKQMGQGLTIPMEEESLRHAVRSIQYYLEDLRKLEVAYRDKVNLQHRLRETEQSLAIATDEYDVLKGEENTIIRERERLEKALESIERLLASDDAQEIQQKIRYCAERLAQIPQELQMIQHTKGQTEASVRELRMKQREADSLLKQKTALLEAWRKVFHEEYLLGLWRYTLDQQTEEIPQAEETELEVRKLDQLAIRSVKTLAPAIQAANRERESYNNRVQNVFDTERQVHLLEYQASLDYTLAYTDRDGNQEAMESVEVLETTEWSREWEDLKARAKRRIIVLEYEGKRTHPYVVLDKLGQEIELQRILLTTEDRKIFEEVILQSVGRVIKHRIARAEKWVERMNELMQQRDSSSGLTFSLKWVPLVADDETQLDTRDLVDYLRRDPKLMRDQDIERITTHFRSRIEKAKQEVAIQREASGETLHQVMKRILDYRQWFSFKLWYRREGEPTKELTDRHFFQFSGGEKAMAMYIPLFSAVFSRYQEADKFSPRVISLDEAFAGVDENNIRDMFELVEQLGFNYIMNSQALWGDYHSVSHLAICELIRPKNADYVTVARYRWDGHTLRMLHPEWTELQPEYDEVAASMEWDQGE